MLTISYGHGLSASPLHLASAYATITNGGVRVTPTLVKRQGMVPGEQVISPRVSARVRDMLRLTVTEGTATFAEVPGYEVAGKTGTADKPSRTGGYYEDKVITTFASVFPASDPKYVLVVSLDEPEDTMGEEPRRTAGWTAVPVAAEVIRRVAPLMGLAPSIEQDRRVGLSLGTN
jgi:cell division protein FtsI (penicillin-binding protein 3)